MHRSRPTARAPRVARLGAVVAAAAGVAAAAAAIPDEPGPAPMSAAAPRPVDAAAWPMYRGNPALQGTSESSLPDRPALLWTFEIGTPCASSAVIAEGRVYVGADDGKMHCLALEDGSELWSFPTGDMIEAPPVIIEGRIFFGSSDRWFYALEPDGTLAWKAETGDQILGSANWLAGEDGEGPIVVVGSYDHTLYAYRAATGELRWQYTTGDRLNGSPAVLGDRVVVGGCDTRLHVVSGRTGEPIEAIEMGDACHIAASVGGVGDRVYFGHYGNEYVCVDLAAKEVIWRYPNRTQAFFSPPAIGADVVVFGGRDKRLHCVDRETGEARWTYPARRKIDSGAVICGDRVVFAAEDGRLRIVRLTDGEETWAYDAGKPIPSSPAVADGRVVVATNDGRVLAFGPEPTPDGAAR